MEQFISQQNELSASLQQKVDQIFQKEPNQDKSAEFNQLIQQSQQYEKQLDPINILEIQTHLYKIQNQLSQIHKNYYSIMQQIQITGSKEEFIKLNVFEYESLISQQLNHFLQIYLYHNQSLSIIQDEQANINLLNLLIKILKICNSFEICYYCLFIILHLDLQNMNQQNRQIFLDIKDFLQILRESSKNCLLFDLFQSEELYKHELFKTEKKFLQVLDEQLNSDKKFNIELVHKIAALASGEGCDKQGNALALYYVMRKEMNISILEEQTEGLQFCKKINLLKITLQRKQPREIMFLGLCCLLASQDSKLIRSFFIIDYFKIQSQVNSRKDQQQSLLAEVALTNFKLIFSVLYKALQKLEPEQNEEQELTLLNSKELWQIPKDNIFEHKVHIEFLMNMIQYLKLNQHSDKLKQGIQELIQKVVGLLNIFCKNLSKGGSKIHNLYIIIMVNRIFELNTVCIEDENFKYTIKDTIKNLISSPQPNVNNKLMANLSREALNQVGMLLERCSSESVNYPDLFNQIWNRLKNKEYHFTTLFETLLSKFYKKVEFQEDFQNNYQKFVISNLLSMPILEKYTEKSFILNYTQSINVAKELLEKQGFQTLEQNLIKIMNELQKTEQVSVSGNEQRLQFLQTLMIFNARKSQFIIEYLLLYYITPLIEQDQYNQASDFLWNLLELIHPCSVFSFAIDTIIDNRLRISIELCFIKFLEEKTSKINFCLFDILRTENTINQYIDYLLQNNDKQSSKQEKWEQLKILKQLEFLGVLFNHCFINKKKIYINKSIQLMHEKKEQEEEIPLNTLQQTIQPIFNQVIKICSEKVPEQLLQCFNQLSAQAQKQKDLSEENEVTNKINILYKFINNFAVNIIPFTDYRPITNVGHKHCSALYFIIRFYKTLILRCKQKKNSDSNLNINMIIQNLNKEIEKEIIIIEKKLLDNNYFSSPNYSQESAFLDFAKLVFLSHFTNISPERQTIANTFYKHFQMKDEQIKDNQQLYQINQQQMMNKEYFLQKTVHSLYLSRFEQPLEMIKQNFGYQMIWDLFEDKFHGLIRNLAARISFIIENDRKEFDSSLQAIIGYFLDHVKKAEANQQYQRKFSLYHRITQIFSVIMKCVFNAITNKQIILNATEITMMCKMLTSIIQFEAILNVEQGSNQEDSQKKKEQEAAEFLFQEIQLLLVVIMDQKQVMEREKLYFKQKLEEFHKKQSNPLKVGFRVFNIVQQIDDIKNQYSFQFVLAFSQMAQSIKPMLASPADPQQRLWLITIEQLAIILQDLQTFLYQEPQKYSENKLYYLQEIFKCYPLPIKEEIKNIQDLSKLIFNLINFVFQQYREQFIQLNKKISALWLQQEENQENLNKLKSCIDKLKIELKIEDKKEEDKQENDEINEKEQQQKQICKDQIKLKDHEQNLLVEEQALEKQLLEVHEDQQRCLAAVIQNFNICTLKLLQQFKMMTSLKSLIQQIICHIKMLTTSLQLGDQCCEQEQQQQQTRQQQQTSYQFSKQKNLLIKIAQIYGDILEKVASVAWVPFCYSFKNESIFQTFFTYSIVYFLMKEIQNSKQFICLRQIKQFMPQFIDDEQQLTDEIKQNFLKREQRNKHLCKRCQKETEDSPTSKGFSDCCYKIILKSQIWQQLNQFKESSFYKSNVSQLLREIEQRSIGDSKHHQLCIFELLILKHFFINFPSMVNLVWNYQFSSQVQQLIFSENIKDANLGGFLIMKTLKLNRVLHSPQSVIEAKGGKKWLEQQLQCFQNLLQVICEVSVPLMDQIDNKQEGGVQVGGFVSEILKQYNVILYKESTDLTQFYMHLEKDKEIFWHQILFLVNSIQKIISEYINKLSFLCLFESFQNLQRLVSFEPSKEVAQLQTEIIKCYQFNLQAIQTKYINYILEDIDQPLAQKQLLIHQMKNFFHYFTKESIQEYNKDNVDTLIQQLRELDSRQQRYQAEIKQEQEIESSENVSIQNQEINDIDLNFTSLKFVRHLKKQLSTISQDNVGKRVSSLVFMSHLEKQPNLADSIHFQPIKEEILLECVQSVPSQLREKKTYKVHQLNSILLKKIIHEHREDIAFEFFKIQAKFPESKNQHQTLLSNLKELMTEENLKNLLNLISKQDKLALLNSLDNDYINFFHKDLQIEREQYQLEQNMKLTLKKKKKKKNNLNISSSESSDQEDEVDQEEAEKKEEELKLQKINSTENVDYLKYSKMTPSPLRKKRKSTFILHMSDREYIKSQFKKNQKILANYTHSIAIPEAVLKIFIERDIELIELKQKKQTKLNLEFYYFICLNPYNNITIYKLLVQQILQQLSAYNENLEKKLCFFKELISMNVFLPLIAYPFFEKTSNDEMANKLEKPQEEEKKEKDNKQLKSEAVNKNGGTVTVNIIIDEKKVKKYHLEPEYFLQLSQVTSIYTFMEKIMEAIKKESKLKPLFVNFVLLFLIVRSKIKLPQDQQQLDFLTYLNLQSEKNLHVVIGQQDPGDLFQKQVLGFIIERCGGIKFIMENKLLKEQFSQFQNLQIFLPQIIDLIYSNAAQQIQNHVGILREFKDMHFDEIKSMIGEILQNFSQTLEQLEERANNLDYLMKLVNCAIKVQLQKEIQQYQILLNKDNLYMQDLKTIRNQILQELKQKVQQLFYHQEQETGFRQFFEYFFEYLYILLCFKDQEKDEYLDFKSGYLNADKFYRKTVAGFIQFVDYFDIMLQQSNLAQEDQMANQHIARFQQIQQLNDEDTLIISHLAMQRINSVNEKQEQIEESKEEDMLPQPQLNKNFSSIVERNSFNLLKIYQELLSKPNFTWLIRHFMKDQKDKEDFEVWYKFFGNIKSNHIQLSEKLDLAQTLAKNCATELQFSQKVISISVDRKNIWTDSMFQLIKYHPKELTLAKFNVAFEHEGGIDQGGLTNEWLSLLVKDMFDPDKGFWVVSQNGVTVQPNPYSYLIPDHLLHFLIAGRIIGKIFLMKKDCDIDFTKSFLKLILNRELCISDIEDIDPEEGRNLMWFLENDVTGCELNFSYTKRYLDIIQTIELKKNGEQCQVNEQNKKEYVKLLVLNKLQVCISQQVSSFRQGFYDVVSKKALSIFNEKDLGLALSGVKVIDVKELALYMNYSGGYNKDSKQVKWFIEVLESFSNEMRAKLLFFVTGSFKMPFGGFKEQPIKLAQRGKTTHHPVAHTCYNTIDLPPYETKEDLQKKLEYSINEGIGFFID